MTRTWLVVMAAAVLAAGCGRTARPHAAGESARQIEVPDSDYATPPQPRSASADASGTVVLTGVSRPDSLIRLASPDGAAIGATANHSGQWSIPVEAGDEPRLFSVSEDVNGRPLRARGYVAALPHPEGASALLQPGAGAIPLGPRRPLQIAAVDFDSSGAAVVSGVARPHEVVRLILDGAEAGEDRADALGRFALSLPRAMPPGDHVLTAQTATGRSLVAFNASPAAPLPKPPFAATRAGAAWRIDWITPGGGVQTTVVFDPAGARA